MGEPGTDCSSEKADLMVGWICIVKVYLGGDVRGSITMERSCEDTFGREKPVLVSI